MKEPAAVVGAVVVGGDYRGLGIVRSLGRRGIPVVVVHGSDTLARHSRYCTRAVHHTGGEDAGLVDLLVRLATREGLEGWVLFPTADETAWLFGRHRDTLAAHYAMTVPTWDVLAVAADKRATHSVAASAGVATARTWFPRGAEDLDAFTAADFPLVLKPSRRQERNAITSAKAWRADDAAQLRRRYRDAIAAVPAEEVMVQEWVPGDGSEQFSFGAVCVAGEPRVSVTARRTRQYPRDFGRASCFVETVDEPAVAATATRLLAALRVDGLAEVEFKRSATGELLLLDVNVRAWGWHSIGAAAGADFAHAAYQHALGVRVPVQRGRAGVRWTRLALDAPYAAKEVLARREKAAPILASLRPPLAGAVAASDDRLPGLLEVPLLVRTVRRSRGSSDAPRPAGQARAVPIPLDDPRWVEFVAHHPLATPFHLPAWANAVAETYRFRTSALAWFDRSGTIAGGLPLVEVRRPTGRLDWVSLPFTDHCPPLTSAPPQAWLPAVRAALGTAGVRALELRDGLPETAGTPVAVRHVLKLGGDYEAVARGFHKSQVLRNIRRAEREGVTVRVGTAERDLTEVFFGLHLATRCRQGVPVQPRRFFALLWRHVLAPGHGSVLVAERHGVPLAAAVFLRHNGTVVYKFGASLDSAWPHRPNHALFAHAIARACADGDTALDWGRTDFGNAGLRAFKSAWGAEEVDLDYCLVPAVGEASAVPPHDVAESRVGRGLARVVRGSPPWVCTALGEALYRFTA